MLKLDDRDLKAIAADRANRDKKSTIIFNTIGVILLVFMLSALISSELGNCYNLPLTIGVCVLAFVLLLWFFIRVWRIKKRILKQIKEEYIASDNLGK